MCGAWPAPASGGQASNVIPATATASLDIRLVPGMDARQTNNRVVEHIRKQGFFVVDQEPDAEMRRSHAKVALVTVRGGDNAVRTPMDLPIAQEVIRMVESVRGPTVKLPNMGGSLPLTSIVRPLGTHVIVVPIANHDDNQHSFNENLRLKNFWDGIELMAACWECEGHVNSPKSGDFRRGRRHRPCAGAASSNGAAFPFRVVGRGKAKLEAAFGKMTHAEVFDADLTDLRSAGAPRAASTPSSMRWVSRTLRSNCTRR